jgi:hypothetical protein
MKIKKLKKKKKGIFLEKAKKFLPKKSVQCPVNLANLKDFAKANGFKNISEKEILKLKKNKLEKTARYFK